MTGIVITTDDKVEIRNFSAPLHESFGAAVGGWIEIVHPVGLKRPYVMIVNEEGLLLGLDMNVYGSLLYGTRVHGYQIKGDIVLMKTGIADGEPDVVGLSDDEAAKIFEEAEAVLKPYRKAKEMFING